MELIIGLIIMGLMGVLMGFRINQRVSVDYKKRWQEALTVIKQEQLNSEELKKIETPIEIPERLKHRESVPSYASDFFKGLSGDQREEMELYRLSIGLPPKDAMGGAPATNWTRVRKKQLEYGWEHFDRYYFKIK